MQRWIHSLAVASLLGGASCQERDASQTRAMPDTTHALAAPATASNETTGFCSEHGVLEAVCTKCNPKLIPVFQAKGDWCQEHGYPESFCPQCHPERGGKPSADVSADGAPADGTKIRLKSKETAEIAGIETVPVIETRNKAGVAAVARIAYDATRVAHVNARAEGVVRTIHVQIGTRIKRGAPLATIESAGVGADQSKLKSAQARLDVAQANYGRAKDLLEKGIVSSKEVLLAQEELEVAKADLESTRRALHVVGAGDGEGSYSLTAPLSGIVTQCNTSIGTLVDIEATLFEIVDPSRMWAEIDIREPDLTRVRVGQRVTVTVDGFGDREFTGKIEYIAPSIDPKTRTAQARARLANPDGVLRANMYGRAQIASDQAGTSAAVPRNAIQRANGVPVVFVRLEDDLYETRRVSVGSKFGELIELSGRIRPGERVVTEGGFLLKTETLKGSIGAGCCEVETR